MFEQFPYANFHEMNMDWVIKVVKDFLDKYEYIEELIETGKTDIVNLTAEELQALTNKKNELEALLQAWYDSHSADIAQQLASAISAFNTAADNKAAQTIASIPADYTTLSNNVTNISGAINATERAVKDTSIPLVVPSEWEVGSINANTGNPSVTTKQIRTKCFYPISDNGSLTFTGVTGTARVHFSYFYDKNYTYIERREDNQIPTGACFVKFAYGFPSSSSQTVESYGMDNLIADWSIIYVSPIKNNINSIENDIANLKVPSVIKPIAFSGRIALPGTAYAEYENGKIKIYGTTTANRILLIFNKTPLVKATPDPFVPSLASGVYTPQIEISGYAANEINNALHYTTTTFDNRIVTTTTFVTNAAVMAGVLIKTNVDYGTESNPTYIDAKIIDYNSKYLQTTNDFTDRKNDILARVNLYGACYLGAGDFYITPFSYSGDIFGSGMYETRLIYRNPEENSDTYAVRLLKNSTMHNLSLLNYHANGEDITPVEDYSLGLNGIYITSSGSQADPYFRCSIENVVIKNFEGCGLFVKDTGYAPSNGSHFANLHIYHCSAGIYLGEFAEFCKCTDCAVQYCYSGAVVMGGNNVLLGCNLSSNEIGLAMPDTDGYGSSVNDAHGIIEACTIVHTGYYTNQSTGVANDGYILKIGAQSSTEIISNCTFSNGKINVADRANGLMFVGCDFKNNTRMTVDGCPILIVSSIIRTGEDSPSTVLNSGVIYRKNCFSALTYAELSDVT